MSENPEPEEQAAASELEREERRLERLRLVVNTWPTPSRADEFEPGPQDAA
jgi:hypothetical protein